METKWPPYTLTDFSGTPVDQLGHFDKLLDEAQKKGVVSDLPEKEETAYNLQDQQIRLQTIASWLHLLGYLKKKLKKEEIKTDLDEIKKAVFQFQKEADLTQDGWTGTETWHALQELISFELDFKKEQWFEDNTIKLSAKRAVHRAIQLRLFSLGLYPSKPDENFILLSVKALKKFNIIIQLFELKPSGYESSFNLETIRLLFDQDQLVKAIASKSSPDRRDFKLMVKKGFLKSGKAQIKLGKRFLSCCAKIELWLLGFEVPIDGVNDYEVENNNNLLQALIDYYTYFQGKSIEESKRFAKKISPELFISMVETIENENTYDEDDASHLILEEVGTEEKVTKAWEYVHTKGSSLWDGLKRIWRWIKKVGKKVLHFLDKNIFRSFFRFVSKAYKIVKKGVKIIVDSITTYIKGHLNQKEMSYVFTKDMDTFVFLKQSISEQNNKKAIQAIQFQTRAFTISAQILSYVIKTFLKVVTGVMGWAKLLMSLVKSYKNIKKLYEEFKVLMEMKPQL